MNKKNCLLVDGNNLIYSSYYVSLKFSSQFNKKKTIFFFFRVLISILKKNNYQKLIIFFDGGGSNFRKKILPEYKNHRIKMPEELYKEMKEIKFFLDKIGIVNFFKRNNEADDLISSFVEYSKKVIPELNIHIFTRDKDLLALLEKNKEREIKVLKYIEKKMFLYSIDDFFKEYNFSPVFFSDYLSLTGDKSDNIIGIKGIGPITAKNLIYKFNNIENIYLNFNELDDNLKKLLKKSESLLSINKKVISLKTDVKIPKYLIKNSDFSLDELINNSEVKKLLNI